jgi:hypothetical protein
MPHAEASSRTEGPSSPPVTGPSISPPVARPVLRPVDGMSSTGLTRGEPPGRAHPPRARPGGHRQPLRPGGSPITGPRTAPSGGRARRARDRARTGRSGSEPRLRGARVQPEPARGSLEPEEHRVAVQRQRPSSSAACIRRTARWSSESRGGPRSAPRAGTRGSARGRAAGGRPGTDHARARPESPRMRSSAPPSTGPRVAPDGPAEEEAAHGGVDVWPPAPDAGASGARTPIPHGGGNASPLEGI